MKITIVKKASNRVSDSRVCPFVIEGVPEQRK
jgi:hypothetical protein